MCIFLFTGDLVYKIRIYFNCGCGFESLAVRDDMTQSVIIQVGQCGNQIGCRFWDLALREHAQYNKSAVYDEPLSNFFRNVDIRHGNHSDIPLGDGKGKIKNLKARAVLVDMEEGVVSELLKGPLGEVFDHQQLLTDVSGSGNNWAVGNKMYGHKYKDQISETLRTTVEHCDCLQSFFLLHSMGGGTGSGVGTKLLEILQDEYPDVYRFTTAVYPSGEDDVITSPYNSVLAMKELTDKADCVLPVENQALLDICEKASKAVQRPCHSASAAAIKQHSEITSSKGGVSQHSKPFDDMNNIVANLLLNLTSASRFEGDLNVDLNEITMNLVPYPRLHYLVSAISPLYCLKDVSLPPRRLDQIFSDAFSRDYQLIKADPKHSLYLACALILRGKVDVSDIRRNIDRLRSSLHFIHWNQEGWKTGLCSAPPVGQPYSLLSLANNTCFKHSLTGLRDSFIKLYKRKAHLHHYTQVDGMDAGLFAESLESLTSLIAEYDKLDTSQQHTPKTEIPRLKVL
ncbi:tubulin epsilon chain-like [Dysidea avara]|uniref:tubulin epsilon chain-like n=1 Tax=Dysidea avara TaxID=196820 RepID=UPI00332F61CB